MYLSYELHNLVLECMSQHLLNSNSQWLWISRSWSFPIDKYCISHPEFHLRYKSKRDFVQMLARFTLQLIPTGLCAFLEKSFSGWSIPKSPDIWAPSHSSFESALSSNLSLNVFKQVLPRWRLGLFRLWYYNSCNVSLGTADFQLRPPE